MYTVLFDLGNVLINFNHRIISQRLSLCTPEERQSTSLEDDIHTFIFGDGEQSSPNVQLDRGTKSIDELHNDVVQQFDIDVSNATFREIWSSIFADELNADAIGCLNQLRGHGLNIAICSNTNSAHWIPLLDQHAVLKDLATNGTCFLSYELGKQKADAGFFDGIAEITKSPPSHHLLIDDLDENCRSAESAGMHAILFRPDVPSDSINRINEFVNEKGWVGHRE